MGDSNRLVAVLGATGRQGGAALRYLLEKDFKVRAITRNPDSDKGKELAQNSNVEVVKASLDDKDSLVKAFSGCYGVFAVTNFWETMSPETEIGQAKNIAEAAAESKVKHVVWSTLEDTRKFVKEDDENFPTLGGKYKVPHLDSKGESDKFFVDNNVPTTFLYTSFYWSNFIYFGLNPRPDGKGKYALSMPMGDSPLIGVDTEDIGKAVAGILSDSSTIGKKIGVMSDSLTVEEIAQKMSKALGKDIYYNKISRADFASQGFPGAEDLANMFAFFDIYHKEMKELRDKGFAYFSEPVTFDKWVDAHISKMPLG